MSTTESVTQLHKEYDVKLVNAETGAFITYVLEVSYINSDENLPGCTLLLSRSSEPLALFGTDTVVALFEKGT